MFYGDTFFLEKTNLLFNTPVEAAQGAVGADDTVAGNLGKAGGMFESLADGTGEERAGAEAAGNFFIRGNSAGRDFFD